MTLRAGRLTPAAKVEVAHSTEMAPVLYAFSTSSRSSDVSPACLFIHSLIHSFVPSFIGQRFQTLNDRPCSVL